jgi:hypothetical protein
MPAGRFDDRGAMGGCGRSLAGSLAKRGRQIKGRATLLRRCRRALENDGVKNWAVSRAKQARWKRGGFTRCGPAKETPFHELLLMKRTGCA